MRSFLQSTGVNSYLLEEVTPVVFTQKKAEPRDVWIEDGTLKAIERPGLLGKRKELGHSKRLSCKGKFLLPGLVDLNCTVREPGAEHVENFATVSGAALRGGFTGLVVQPNTNPVHDNAFVTDLIVRRAKEKALVSVFSMGAATKALEGVQLAEIGAMVGAGAQVIGDGSPIQDGYLFRKILEYSKAFGVTVFSLPMDKVLTGRGVMHEGFYSNRLGLRGIPSVAEEVGVARDIALARHTGAQLHLQSLSTKRAVELVRRAKQEGLPITADTNPAYFTLSCSALDSYNTSLKVFPPLRTEEDVEAVVEGLADGTIDAISSAHTPQGSQVKDQSFEMAEFGMLGLQTAFPLVHQLVLKKKLSIQRCVELLCENPKKVAKIKGDQPLKTGAPIDAFLFSPKEKYVFDRASCFSSSSNSPFWEKTFQGNIEQVWLKNLSWEFNSLPVRERRGH